MFRITFSLHYSPFTSPLCHIILHSPPFAEQTQKFFNSLKHPCPCPKRMKMQNKVTQGWGKWRMIGGECDPIYRYFLFIFHYSLISRKRKWGIKVFLKVSQATTQRSLAQTTVQIRSCYNGYKCQIWMSYRFCLSSICSLLLSIRHALPTWNCFNHPIHSCQLTPTQGSHPHRSAITPHMLSPPAGPPPPPNKNFHPPWPTNWQMMLNKLMCSTKSPYQMSKITKRHSIHVYSFIFV